MSRAHAKLGASSSARWMTCPGSVRLSEGIPDQPTEYALEGTAAHTVAEACLKDGTDAAAWLGKEVAVGERAFPVDDEMAASVQVYLDTVRADLSGGARLQVETTFDLDRFYPGMFGTNDACIYDPSERALQVYDYKHGQGVAVAAEGNPQLMYYALGAAVRERAMPLSRVELVIVQPRCPHPDGPVRRWATPPMDLLDWSAELVAAARRTEEPDAPLATGEHCRFCPALHRCPAFKDEALEVTGANRPTLPEPEDFDDRELGDILTRIRLVEGWMKRVREHAYERATRGHAPAGWKLVEKRALRQWVDEAAVVQRLTEYGLHESDLYEKKILSPAKVDKVLGRNKALIRDLYVKESSGTTLAPLSDRRPAVVPALADFKPNQ